MFSLVEENLDLSFAAMDTKSIEQDERISKNEAIIDFTNSALAKFLIKLSTWVEQIDEKSSARTSTCSMVFSVSQIIL